MGRLAEKVSLEAIKQGTFLPSRAVPEEPFKTRQAFLSSVSSN